MSRDGAAGSPDMEGAEILDVDQCGRVPVSHRSIHVCFQGPTLDVLAGRVSARAVPPVFVLQGTLPFGRPTCPLV